MSRKELCHHSHIEPLAARDSPARIAECVECGLVFAPVLDVRQIVLNSAAEKAATGHPGDALISHATFAVLPAIDAAYPNLVRIPGLHAGS